MKRNIEVIIVVGREQRGVMRAISKAHKRMGRKTKESKRGTEERKEGRKGNKGK
jgi:hypothetical protein